MILELIVVASALIISGLLSLVTHDQVWVVAMTLLTLVMVDVRWWRVAQREHYLPGAVSLFVRRWWFNRRLNAALLILAIVSFVAATVFPSLLLVTVCIFALGPIGLSLRGRTSKLAWTRRLKTLAGVTLVIQVVLGAGLALATQLPTWSAVVVMMIAPNLMEAALALTRKYEDRQAAKFVDLAQKRLRSVSPSVIGITGSYGKTSTKVAIAHLLSGSKTVVASPASFNNRAGVCRTVNEHLVPGTDVLVLELGTYGEGEIAELCEICPPDISVLTAIGPVHLERFGTEAAIIAAKAEIFENSDVAIINIDDDRLAHLADRLEQAGKTLWRCSTGKSADVVVSDSAVRVKGDLLIEGVETLTPGNLACAVAAALAAGVERSEVASRLQIPQPGASHRREVKTNDKGVVIIDDTYNLNPAGARIALEELRNAGSGERRVLVTPGMIELGRRQFGENKQFATEAAAVATVLIFVGRTNRQALVEGAAAAGREPVILVPNLAKAVEWIRANTDSGDAVLYANDLPDHYA